MGKRIVVEIDGNELGIVPLRLSKLGQWEIDGPPPPSVQAWLLAQDEHFAAIERLMEAVREIAGRA